MVCPKKNVKQNKPEMILNKKCSRSNAKFISRPTIIYTSKRNLSLCYLGR